MALDDDLVEHGGVGGVEGGEAQVIDDEQINPQQLAHLGLVAVVEARGPKVA